MEQLGQIGSGLAAAFAQVNRYTATLSGTFTVTPTNVLAAAKIIHAQAEALEEKLLGSRGDLEVAPPGDDDVSIRIAPAWNDLLVYNEDSYTNRIQQYIDGLYNLAKQCAESAKAYGYAEDEIANAFGARRA